MRKFSYGSGHKVYTVAGSRHNAPPIFDRLFATQTQALSLRLDRNRSLDSGGSRDLGLEYLHRFKEGAERDAFWLKEREGLNRQVEREAGLMYWEERLAAVEHAVE